MRRQNPHLVKGKSNFTVHICNLKEGQMNKIQANTFCVIILKTFLSLLVYLSVDSN